jgi:spore coat polysaccharide biosynthesis protein SpsF
MEVGLSGNKTYTIKAGIIIQARMDSTRLPGKVLMPAGSSTIFEILIKRVKESGLPVILATSETSSNDVLERKANELSIGCYRGSEEDVLSRYYEAAKTYKLDVIVRITGDNPFSDGRFIRKYVDEYINLNNQNLYISTGSKKTLPLGISFEIFSFQMLEAAYKNATDIKQKEHVTPYFYTNPQLFTIMPVSYSTDKSAYRLTLDTNEDLILIKTLIEEYNAADLGYEDIISIMDNNPYLQAINSDVKQKKWID